MKRIIVLFAICACLLSCIALSSCDSSSDCKHPHDKVSYSYYMSEEGIGHNAFCNECHKDLGWERCDTPDGKCGKCPTCGYESEHQYVSTGEKNDEGHQVNCFRCKDTTYMPHELSVLDYLSYVRPTEHDMTMHCYTCGFETKVIGSHTSASNEWKTSEVNHWKLCDVCKGEFEFGIHNLVDGACTVCAYSAETLPATEYLTFELSPDETYYIVTGMQKEMLSYNTSFSLVIPDTYNDKPVKAIGSMAFNNYYSDGYIIVSLYIPEGVTEIQNDAFQYNRMLRDVSLPSTLEVIGNGAFGRCAIVNLTIPAKAVVCTDAFLENESLKTLVVEEGVKEIGSSAFYGCRSLESVTLPSTLEVMDASVFEYCDSIITFKVDERNTKFVSVDNCLISIADNMLLRSNASMTVPSMVKIISKYALSCDNIYYVANKDRLVKRDVVLPLGLELIEDGALSYSTVKTVSFPNSSGNNGKYVAGTNYIYDKASLILLWGNEECVIPNEVKQLGEKSFSFCTFGDFVIPSNIEKVAYNSFFNCSFNSVTIEDGVCEIMFAECSTNQKEITIPPSIKILSNGKYYSHAFGLAGLEKVILSEGVEGLEVYFDCQVVLPSTLKYVGEFVDIGTLNVTEYAGCKYFGDENNPYYILLGPVQTKTVTELKIHKDTKIIAKNAFIGEDTIRNIVFEGDKLEYICDGAFSSALYYYEGTLTLPDSIKYLGFHAFYSASSYQESFKIVLGSGLVATGDYIICERGLWYENMVYAGGAGYLGTADNPYYMIAEFDPFNVDGYEGWGEVDYIIKKDTKIIASGVGNWFNPIYEGTMAEFKEIYISDAFKEDLNKSELHVIICTDGEISTLE